MTDLAVGDRVLGMVLGGFGPLAVTDRRLVVPVPEGWSWVQAAALPSVFATARYALADLAEVKPGDKVLVHAAAGGVGMAAVRVARSLGAEVFGTASPSKHGVLAPSAWTTSTSRRRVRRSSPTASRRWTWC